MSERKPQPGDRVRITYEAVYRNEWEAGGMDGTVTYPADATVEVLEPADDPSKDPAGTVRQHDDGSIVVRCGDHWRATENGIDFEHADVANGEWNVIGAVPGTPAAEQEQPIPEWEMDLLRRESAEPGPRPVQAPDPHKPVVLKKADTSPRPRVFRSDGPEPPPDVKVVRSKRRTNLAQDPHYLKRCEHGGWLWVSLMADDAGGIGLPWPGTATGKLVEVLDV